MGNFLLGGYIGDGKGQFGDPLPIVWLKSPESL
jgi:hypothetical protein